MRSSIRTRAAAVAALSLALGAALLWSRGLHLGPDAALEAIRDELAKVPQVELLELTGVVDDEVRFLPRMEHICARIKVAGKTELLLTELSKRSFATSGHLILAAVGPHAIRVRGERFLGNSMAATGEPVLSEFGASSIDIGPEGEFAQLFPFELPNVQAAVDHHEEIARIVGSWPESPAAPRSLTGARGEELFYWIVKPDLAEADPAWDSPLAALRARAERASSAAPAQR
ncbi:MAG: hypothetical protein R3F49_16265 [Planctomycetota bacterium]